MSIFPPKIRISGSLSWSPCWLLEIVADHQSQPVIRSLLQASHKLTQTQEILLQPPSQAFKFCKISFSTCVVVVSVWHPSPGFVGVTVSRVSPLAEPAWPHLGYKKLGLVTRNVSGGPGDFGWVSEHTAIAVRVSVYELQIFSEVLSPVLDCTGE